MRFESLVCDFGGHFEVLIFQTTMWKTRWVFSDWNSIYIQRAFLVNWINNPYYSGNSLFSKKFIAKIHTAIFHIYMGKYYKHIYKNLNFKTLLGYNCPLRPPFLKNLFEARIWNLSWYFEKISHTHVHKQRSVYQSLKGSHIQYCHNEIISIYLQYLLKPI